MTEHMQCTCGSWLEHRDRILKAYESIGESPPETILTLDWSATVHDTTCPNWIEWRDLRSFVYFIRAGTCGPIKIGKSDDPNARLKALQTASPHPLVLLGAARGGEPLERSLHDYLSDDRLMGEWFHPSERVNAIIDAVLQYVAPQWELEYLRTR